MLRWEGVVYAAETGLVEGCGEVVDPVWTVGGAVAGESNVSCVVGFSAVEEVIGANSRGNCGTGRLWK